MQFIYFIVAGPFLFVRWVITRNMTHAAIKIAYTQSIIMRLLRGRTGTGTGAGSVHTFSGAIKLSAAVQSSEEPPPLFHSIPFESNPYPLSTFHLSDFPSYPVARLPGATQWHAYTVNGSLCQEKSRRKMYSGGQKIHKNINRKISATKYAFKKGEYIQ